MNAAFSSCLTYWRLRARKKSGVHARPLDRKSTRLNSSHDQISYAVFCLKKKKRSYRSRSPKWRFPAPAATVGKGRGLLRTRIRHDTPAPVARILPASVADTVAPHGRQTM